MSIEELKATVASLPLEQQNHLAAYLVHLRHLHDPVLRDQLATRIEERDAAKWVSVDELRGKWSD
jgi:hypothetical protein